MFRCDKPYSCNLEWVTARHQRQHETWNVESLIKPFNDTCQVVLLTETEEKCVHTHGVHTEESMGNEVGANYHSLVRKTRTSCSDFIQNTNITTTWVRTPTGRKIQSYTPTLLCSWLDMFFQGKGAPDSPGWAPSSSGDWELYSQRPLLFQRRKRRQRSLWNKEHRKLTFIS